VHFIQNSEKANIELGFRNIYVTIVIHIKKAHKLGKNDLYTKLCTLSTAFLCKLLQFIMVTEGTFVLWSSPKNEWKIKILRLRIIIFEFKKK